MSSMLENVEKYAERATDGGFRDSQFSVEVGARMGFQRPQAESVMSLKTPPKRAWNGVVLEDPRGSSSTMLGSAIEKFQLNRFLLLFIEAKYRLF
jgi:hypothetical protein